MSFSNWSWMHGGKRCAVIQAGGGIPVTLSLPAIAKQAERPVRLIHFKVDVLQLFASLNLQNDWITGVKGTHRCPQLLDGVHASCIK
jgi:hypothetical protein